MGLYIANELLSIVCLFDYYKNHSVDAITYISCLLHMIH